jgi:hypothetical protein
MEDFSLGIRLNIHLVRFQELTVRFKLGTVKGFLNLLPGIK